MVAKVAIDLALDRLFDYEVPEALKEKLAVGQLLSVPFNHREARGFVLALAEKSESAFALKPVAGIVDETPFFSPKLLELIKSVARYTAAPIESVLKAALPAAVLKKNAHPQERLFIEPALGAEPVTLTKRQEWLYAQIARLGGGWMRQLCTELQTTPATLRTLGQLGLVKAVVRTKRRDPLAASRILPSKPLALNDGQKAALDACLVPQGAPLLLHGITGSGKTEVYLQAIASELAADRGAIVMVPEIALTPQTVQRFASRFGDRVAVLHSALSDGERYDEWHRIRKGEARVVVGPRSAVWAPVRNLGLIVVDEEHEGSYKQDDTPRYNARDVAVLRATTEGAKVVLGSATPSLESWHNAAKGKYRLVQMTKRAGAGTLPVVHLVAMNPADGGAREGGIFSRELMDAIRLRLDRHEQTILFLNRRGYSRQVTCESCGYVAACPNCSTDDHGMPYTYHRADNCLRCHICGGWVPVPAACPVCAKPTLAYRGIGTQRAEAALKKCFPNAAVLRMDADSTSRKNSHDDILSAFRRGEADILIGTQMIAKGLDFPNVTLVGILNADSALNMPDFRASERAYQLFAQVAGRAGRAELPGEVYIQTFDVQNGVLNAVLHGGFDRFAAHELNERKNAGFPPYCHLAAVSLRSKDLRSVGDWATLYAEGLKAYASAVNRRKLPDVGLLLVSEAIPSALEKADGWYRWQIVLRAPTSAEIVRAWRWIVRERPAPATLRVALDVDALNLV